MRTIEICKASAGPREVEPVNIVIRKSLPVFTGDFRDQANEFYFEEAHDIFAALRDSLPQATLDRLTVLMLERQCSLLRIQWPPKGVTPCPEKIA